MSKGSFLVVFYGNEENYLQVALFSWHSNANLIIAHHNYGIRVWLCLISKTYITSSCSPAQPDPVPNRYAGEWVWGHGHTKFVLLHIYDGGQLPLANYREQPSSTTNRNSCAYQPPFPKLGLAIMANLRQEFRYKGGGALTTSKFLQNKFGMAMSPDPPRTLRATWVWLCQTTTAHEIIFRILTLKNYLPVLGFMKCYSPAVQQHCLQRNATVCTLLTQHFSMVRTQKMSILGPKKTLAIHPEILHKQQPSLVLRLIELPIHRELQCQLSGRGRMDTHSKEQ